MSDESLEQFVDRLMSTRSVAAVRDIADEVSAMPDGQSKQARIIVGTQANPLFAPRAKQGPDLSPAQFMALVARARQTAAQGESLRLIVSAPMKSGSTYVSEALVAALKTPKISLMMQLVRPYDYAPLGAGVRAHEIDELALLTACLSPVGFVAHHHMLGEPYLARQTELYRLRFILMKRNIFDCLVSLDDFCLKSLTGQTPEGAYFKMLLPPGWSEMDSDARMARLLDRFLTFYVNYHVSWRLLERQGSVQPLWVSYEDHILGDKERLAAELSDWLHLSDERAERLRSLFSNMQGSKDQHFNKGVAGRGKVIQGANRERVIEAFSGYASLADWSEILD